MDPDFIPPLRRVSLDESFDSNDSGSSTRRHSPSPFLLRSECHHKNNEDCKEGHGIEFHSRISPSPNRSFHRRRRRRSGSSRRTPSVDERDDVSLKRTGPLHSAPARMQTNDDDDDEPLINVNSLTGSPRLRAFDGRKWFWSDRTGYSYGMSPTYRKEWTPDRQTPMPNMARWPIPYYNDGEVSFGKGILKAKRRLDFDSFHEDKALLRRFFEALLTFFMMILTFPIIFPVKVLKLFFESVTRILKITYNQLLRSLFHPLSCAITIGTSHASLKLKALTLTVVHYITTRWHRVKESYLEFFTTTESREASTKKSIKIYISEGMNFLLRKCMPSTHTPQTQQQQEQVSNAGEEERVAQRTNFITQLFEVTTNIAFSTKRQLIAIFNKLHASARIAFTRSDEEGNNVFVHEIIYRKIKRIVLKFSSVIWPKEKKQVRFPDGLKTPRIVEGLDVSVDEVEQAENEAAAKAEAALLLRKRKNLIANVFHFAGLVNAFKKRKIRRKEKVFREGTRKSLRLQGLPPEFDLLPVRIRRVQRRPRAENPSQGEAESDAEEEVIEVEDQHTYLFYFTDWIYQYFVEERDQNDELDDNETLYLALLNSTKRVLSFPTALYNSVFGYETLKVRQRRELPPEFPTRKSFRLQGLDVEFHGDLPVIVRKRRQRPDDEDDYVAEVVREGGLINWIQGLFNSKDSVVLGFFALLLWPIQPIVDCLRALQAVLIGSAVDLGDELFDLPDDRSFPGESKPDEDIETLNLGADQSRLLSILKSPFAQILCWIFSLNGFIRMRRNSEANVDGNESDAREPDQGVVTFSRTTRTLAFVSTTFWSYATYPIRAITRLRETQANRPELLPENKNRAESERAIDDFSDDDEEPTKNQQRSIDKPQSLFGWLFSSSSTIV